MNITAQGKKCLTFRVLFLNSIFVGPKICLKLKNGTISKAQSKNIIIYTVIG